MEAVPRLPMIHFEMRTVTDNAVFGPALKGYIASFYNEDPESYNAEISNIESLRGAAVRPTVDVSGCQLLKKYYCQLHFLKSRFPMAELQQAAVYFSWKDPYSNLNCGVSDIRYELMNIMYNIGCLHSQLGANESRTSQDGMRMACTHFQCAAWAFQALKENYHQMVPFMSSIEIVHFMQQMCLSQAQECILEKSMMDNRNASTIAKIAVQVVEYYRKCYDIMKTSGEESSFHDLIGSKSYKEWFKYLSLKVAYYKCVSLLFQGQQSEEQQKMGERVAFYQAACDQLEEARKLCHHIKNTKEFNEALGFTSDVVEGKRKAAKNENEFIYHEEVPERQALQEVKGVSLVKGIPFSVNDPDVSGPDIFSRLVPMEAHEASSLYSEKKAQLLRRIGELVEVKDQALAEFMSSLQLEVFNKMRQATGLSQDLVDRAAAMSAKPTAIQELVNAMGKLSNSYHDVESMLNEIHELLKEEEQNEKEYQEVMGKRPPSIIATDLTREAAKYKEAHNKANDSNQNLHKAMVTHVANLKILSQPLRELQHQIPAVEFPNSNIDENCIKEVENLIAKVEEMRNQRAMLWSEFRESVHGDDITSVLVTRQPDQSLEQLFQKELEKHEGLAHLIEQNSAAQENICKAFVDAYARSAPTRRFLNEIINKRNTTVSALVTSFDSYEDLLAKANKGIEFYNKLETNVSKLLQRIKSASKVQQEERDQMLSKNSMATPKLEVPEAPSSTTPVAPGPTPKLKDYLDTRKKMTRPYAAEATPQYQYPAANIANPAPANMQEVQAWPTSIRPAPLGSEFNSDVALNKTNELPYGGYTGGQIYPYEQYPQNSLQPSKSAYGYDNANVEQDLSERFSNLRTKKPTEQQVAAYYSQYNYSIPEAGYTAAPAVTTLTPAATTPTQQNKAYTNTIDTYQPISSIIPSHQYPPSGDTSYYPTGQFPYYPQQAQDATSYSTGFFNPSFSVSANPTAQNYSTASAAVNYTNTPGNHASASGNTGSTAEDAYAAASYQQYGNLYQNYGQVGYGSYGSYYTAPVSNNTGYTNTSMSMPTQPSHSADTQAYSQAPTYTATEQVYSSGYATSTQPYGTATQSYTYPASYDSSSVYPQPPAAQADYASVAQTNPASNTSLTATASQYQPVSPTVNQQPYQSPYTPSQYSSNSGYATAAPAPAPQTPVTPQPPAKGSNMDLLTGLDFTVNQAPLIPSQPTEKPETKPAVAPPQPKAAETPRTNPAQLAAKKEEPVESPTEKINRKPLNNPDVKKFALQEIDKYAKFVEVLGSKTLNGQTNLDLKWKDIQEKQDCDGQRKAISVARCYPMKNRFPDILPYDFTRVELKSSKDDYINASHVKDVSYYSPPFIVTQAPLALSFGEFWTMVREQQVELIACLLGDTEIKHEIYWPTDKNKDLHLAGMVISLISETSKPHWVERLISVAIPEKRDSRVVMQLQFTSWPGSLFPTTPDSFISYITQVLTLYQQQRNTSHPIVVHCSSGIGRSGLACLLMAAISELTNNPTSIPDLISLTMKLNASRKNILRDREHLKFACESFLAYLKQVISQGLSKKILNEVIPTEPPKEEIAVGDVKPEPDDPLSSLDPFWASKK